MKHYRELRRVLENLRRLNLVALEKHIMSRTIGNISGKPVIVLDIWTGRGRTSEKLWLSVQLSPDSLRSHDNPSNQDKNMWYFLS